MQDLDKSFPELMKDEFCVRKHGKSQSRKNKCIRKEERREIDGPIIPFRKLEKDSINSISKKEGNKVEKILKEKTNRINIRLR